MKHLYFVRHGQSYANLKNIIASFDSPLTQLGISQAMDAANNFIDLNIDKIFSSPMPRAKKTAETIADSIGFAKSEIVIMDELKERRLGVLEGKPKSQESRWYFDTSEGYGIETHKELQVRMVKALKQIESLSFDSDNV